ncbi:hypothetical protein [Asaia astilbis]|uniref:hypothetical protein n=1 Tax=Asaia astilbis TaxID=610244 RepID=UPI00068873D9|nr:hypothetical protein [Asaia astilbis]
MNYDWQTLYSQIMPLLPAQIAGNVTDIVTALIAISAVIYRFWKEPAVGSKFRVVWLVVRKIAFARKDGLDKGKP